MAITLAGRNISFDSGHRVLGHQGKCANIHGHTFKVVLNVAPASYPHDWVAHEPVPYCKRCMLRQDSIPLRPCHPADLDKLGMVVDFVVIKQRFGDWINTNWDHGMLISINDNQLTEVYSEHLKDHKCFILPYNPTAENIGRFLIENVGPQVLADMPLQLVAVEVWETENCFAVVSL